MLRKLFYASASILMLALAYHLGATSVSAQSGVVIEGAGVDRGTLSATVNRILFRLGAQVEQLSALPVPGTSPIIMTSGYSETIAMTADGKVYRWSGIVPGTWDLVGDFATVQTVPARSSSWGQLKAQYRK